MPTNPEYDKSRVALVTGASNGIGLELAKILARERYNLILVARTQSKLEELAKEFEKKHEIKCHVIAMDLSYHGAARELYDRVLKLGVSLEILINNAGFGDAGEFINSQTTKVESMMTLNMETLTLVTRYFAAHMVNRGSGRILNIASTAAFQPGPYMAVYYATKAYVLSFTEALAVELTGTGVTATALCPGPVLTGFQAAANMASDAGMLKTPAMLSANKVAEIGYESMKSGEPLAVAGVVNQIMAFSTRFAPRKVAAKIASRFNQSARTVRRKGAL